MLWRWEVEYWKFYLWTTVSVSKKNQNPIIICYHLNWLWKTQYISSTGTMYEVSILPSIKLTLKARNIFWDNLLSSEWTGQQSLGQTREIQWMNVTYLIHNTYLLSCLCIKYFNLKVQSFWMFRYWSCF